jgi:threonine synthase
VQNGIIKSSNQVLVINTGSGLKDVRAAMQAITEPTIIEPSLEALKKVIH